MLIGIRFPVDLSEVGLPPVGLFGGVSVWRGSVGWQWDGDDPLLPIDLVAAPAAVEVAGWGVDHVVVTTPDLDATVTLLEAGGADLRRMGTARGRRAAFFLCGPVIEVVEVDQPDVLLWGLALETDQPLEYIAQTWTSVGWEVSGPHKAIQAGREILSIGPTNLAVMSRR